MSAVPIRRVLFRIRHPRTTVRWRLTLLYGGLFLVCGAALLAITYTLVARATSPTGPVAFTAHPANGARPSPAFLHSLGRVTQQGATKARAAIPPPIQKLLTSRSGRNAVRVLVGGQRISDLHQLEVESGIALAIMAIISGLLGWLVAGRVLRPLRTITSTAQEISEASLHRRLSLPGPRDELRQLADTIDGLLARLEGAFDAQRRFVANASHELRTPLTATRALLEMAISDPHATVASFRETCQQVLKENESQEQLIDALLTLAQGQRGLDRHDHIDLAQTVQQVVDGHELEASASGIRLSSSLAPAPITGDQRLVQRLVSNLVENAIRHNTPGGKAEVVVRPSAEGEAILEVINTGVVIEPDQVDRLVQPFQRLSPERTGHGKGLGLGLSIVSAIVQAHGAQLEIEPRAGGGLVARVRFALAASEADQLVLEDLPEGVAGEGVQELHPAGALERGQPLGGELE
jgi:signal transduction histidine kinase